MHDKKLDRLIKLGQDYRQEHKGQLKGTWAGQFDQWVEILAQHLTQYPGFLRLMENPPDPMLVRTGKAWLARIHLPGRWKRYNTYASFFIAFWTRGESNGVKYREQVVIRAIEIIADAIEVRPTSIKKTKIRPPSDDEEAKQLRSNIYVYQTLRTRMISTMKAAADQQYVVAKKVFAGEGSENDRNELVVLEEGKKELRDRLGTLMAEKEGISVIDALLSEFPPTVQYLLEVDESPSQTFQEDDQEEDDAPDALKQSADDLAVAVREKNPELNIHYYEEPDPMDPTAVYLTAPMEQAKDMEGAAQIEALADPVDLDELDVALGVAMYADKGRIRRLASRFCANLKHFTSIMKRPEHVVNAASHSHFFRITTYYLGVIEDNIFHVKKLISQLRENQLLRPEVSEERLQRTLARMFGLLSLMHGCVVEGSLWLTVMDALLDELSQMVLGEVDAPLNTATMHYFARAAGTDKLQPLLQSDINQMERIDKARRVFSEVVRFYRGCVMLAFVGVSWGHGERDKTTTRWFENRMRWSYVCRLETCHEKLRFKLGPRPEKKEGDVDDDAEDPGEDLEPGEEEERLAIKCDPTFRRSNLSVGVEDARIGQRAERLNVSENRDYAYACLYNIISGVKWHPGFGPFFFYFASLYHHACKAWRGKDVYIATVVAKAKSDV